MAAHSCTARVLRSSPTQPSNFLWSTKQWRLLTSKWFAFFCDSLSHWLPSPLGWTWPPKSWPLYLPKWRAVSCWDEPACQKVGPFLCWAEPGRANDTGGGYAAPVWRMLDSAVSGGAHECTYAPWEGGVRASPSWTLHERKYFSWCCIAHSNVLCTLLCCALCIVELSCMPALPSRTIQHCHIRFCGMTL